MAASCARRTLQISSASAKTLWSCSPPPPSSSSSSSFIASRATKLGGLVPSKPNSYRFPLQKISISRLPVELAGLQSMMPLHNATASALFTSLLSLHNDKWGCLSEGFATPL